MSTRRSQRAAQAGRHIVVDDEEKIKKSRVEKMKRSRQETMGEVTGRSVLCTTDPESSALVIDMGLTDYEEVVATKGVQREAASVDGRRQFMELRAPSSYTHKETESVHHRTAKETTPSIYRKARGARSNAAPNQASTFSSLSDSQQFEIVYETCENVVELPSTCEDTVTTRHKDAHSTHAIQSKSTEVIQSQKCQQFCMPDVATPRKQKTSGQQGVSKETRCIDAVVRKARPPQSVTVIDFQKVKASRYFNEAQGAVSQNLSVAAPQCPAPATSRRYYLESKANPSVSLLLSPQKSVTSTGCSQQISILLPAEHQQVTNSRVGSFKSIVVPRAPVNTLVLPESHTVAQYDAGASNFKGNVRPQFVEFHAYSESSRVEKNYTAMQYNMEQASVVGNSVLRQQSGLVDVSGIHVAKPSLLVQKQDMSMKQHAHCSTTTAPMNPTLDRAVYQPDMNAATAAAIDKTDLVEPSANKCIAESRAAEHDDDAPGAQTEGSGNEADSRRSCRKRKATVPIKNLRSASEATIKSAGGEEEKLTSDEVDANPPTEPAELFFGIETDNFEEPKHQHVSASDSAGSDQKSVLLPNPVEPGCTANDDEVERTRLMEWRVEGNEVIPCQTGMETLSTAEGAAEACDTEEQKEEQPLTNVLKVETAVDVGLGLEAVEQPADNGALDVGAVTEDGAVDDATPDDATVQLNQAVEGNEGYCSHCERQFADAAELSAHMSTNHVCTTCSCEFKQPSNLRKHVRVHHELALKHECIVCGKSFAYKSALKEHELMHEKGESGDAPAFGCEDCDKNFARISGLRRHRKVEHSGDQTYACPQCDRRYSYRCSLKNHMVTHSTDRPYTCDSCGASFKQKCNMLKHMRTQHHRCTLCPEGEPCTCLLPAYECEVCGKSCGGRTQLRLHLRVHSGEKPEVCDLCGQAFQHKSNLVKHRMKHTGTKPYECGFCARGFYSNHSLQSHMRLHTGESPYQCDTCGKRFCTRNGLQVHSVLHTDARPFVCGTCGRAFAQLGNLNKHLAIHTGTRPFPCTHCSMAFVDSSALRRHEVLHTREHNFACNMCDRSFMYLTSLRAHRLTHEHVKPHACSVCGKAFRQKTGYLRHLKTHERTAAAPGGGSVGSERIIDLGQYVVYLTE